MKYSEKFDRLCQLIMGCAQNYAPSSIEFRTLAGLYANLKDMEKHYRAAWNSLKDETEIIMKVNHGAKSEIASTMLELINIIDEEGEDND